MNSMGWLQLSVFIIALAALTKPLGLYLMRMFDPGARTFLDPVFKVCRAAALSFSRYPSRGGTGLEKLCGFPADIQFCRHAVYIRHVKAPAMAPA